MLDLMRKHAKSWLIKVIIGIIALVFIFWGASSQHQGPARIVAEVNGEQILIAEYREAYRNLFNQMKQRYKQIWSDELVKALNLEKQTLDNLINERLLFQRAAALNIEVTEGELRNLIISADYFQVDGVFNVEQYTSVLARSQLTPESFENVKRRELTIQKLNFFIMGFAKVSPQSVKESFHMSNDKINLEFVLFKPEAFSKETTATDEELKAYYEKDKAKYEVPAKVKAVYMAVKPRDMESKVTVDYIELMDYYEINIDRYKQKAKVKARHILFKLDKEDTAEKEAEVKAEAEKVLALAKAGEDFVELAKKYSQGPTGKTGGDLGWFERAAMVAPFSDKAFGMKEGEIGGPVKTRFGYHIIKVEDRREAGSQPFEEVKDRIENLLKKQNAKDLAADMAFEIYEKAGLSKELEVVAKEQGLTAVTTGFFSLNDPLPGIGLNRKLISVAHATDEGEIGPLVDLPDGHYIVKTLKKRKAYIPKFEEVAGKVKADLLDEKAMELAGKQAQKFVNELLNGNIWEKLAETYKVKTSLTGNFTMMGSIPKMGTIEALTEDAFEMKKPGEAGRIAYKGSQGYFAVRLKAILPATDAEFAKQKERETQKLQLEKSQSYFKQWLESVRAISNIVVQEGVI